MSTETVLISQKVDRLVTMLKVVMEAMVMVDREGRRVLKQFDPFQI